MRGERTVRVLEAIGDTAKNVGDVIAVLLAAPYGSSLGRLQYELSRRKRGTAKSTEELERQRYYSLLYKLKRDGLLERKKRSEKVVVTSKGKKFLERLLKRARTAFPQSSYTPTRSDTVTIIAFDIPERERRKRDWFRSAIRNLGFQMVQESVWVGKIKIPKELMNDLRELKLFNCVEIFEVTRSGSLREL